MDPVEGKLNMLIDGMEKKEQALAEIVSITENQRTVIDSGLTEDEIRAFIMQMNREKQGFIKTVLGCDAMFEQVLKEIGTTLDDHPDLYKPQIADLQGRIRRVMDLDVKIRVSEEQNNRRLQHLFPQREVQESQEAQDAQGMQDARGMQDAQGMQNAQDAQDAQYAGETSEPAKFINPSATQKAPPQKPVIKDDAKVLKAYEKNTRNYKG